jgi:RNA polymerase sigma factor (sigma-70 family)
LRLLRGGTTAAADQLWRRHYPATLATARKVTRGDRDAEDVAADAFTGMLRAMQSGAGPTQGIRAYLNTAVRHGAAATARKRHGDVLVGEPPHLDRLMPAAPGPEARVPRQALVRETFRALPPRWQAVLWRTIVHGDSNAEIAQDLALTPNAVAALARRARLGLRRSYLHAYAALTPPSDPCAPYVAMMLDALEHQRPEALAALQQHVDDCPTCSARLVDLRRAHTELCGIVPPAILALVHDEVRPRSTPGQQFPQQDGVSRGG